MSTDAGSATLQHFEYTENYCGKGKSLSSQALNVEMNFSGEVKKCLANLCVTVFKVTT